MLTMSWEKSTCPDIWVSFRNNQPRGVREPRNEKLVVLYEEILGVPKEMLKVFLSPLEVLWFYALHCFFLRIPLTPPPPPEKSHDNGKSPFLKGDTSSNGLFSTVMLVFAGVHLIS